jgi:hypothetical protein
LERDRQDRGEVAGETVIKLCGDYDLDTSSTDVYGTGLHHASLADIIVTHLCSSPSEWGMPAERDWWHPSCYLRENRLTRIILVDHWSEDRCWAECHSWRTLGEIAVYEQPMDMCVIELGATRQGRRYSYWTRGYMNKHWQRIIRFKPIPRVRGGEPFLHTWQSIWREDYSQITAREWLDAMVKNDVMKEVSFIHHVKLVNRDQRQRILDDIMLRRTQLRVMPDVPERRYGVCDWPVPCPFRGCCWAPEETTPDQMGSRFVQLQPSS